MELLPFDRALDSLPLKTIFRAERDKERKECEKEAAIALLSLGTGVRQEESSGEAKRSISRVENLRRLHLCAGPYGTVLWWMEARPLRKVFLRTLMQVHRTATISYRRDICDIGLDLDTKQWVKDVSVTTPSP